MFASISTLLYWKNIKHSSVSFILTLCVPKVISLAHSGEIVKLCLITDVTTRSAVYLSDVIPFRYLEMINFNDNFILIYHKRVYKFKCLRIVHHYDCRSISIQREWRVSCSDKMSNCCHAYMLGSSLIIIKHSLHIQDTTK